MTTTRLRLLRLAAAAVALAVTTAACSDLFRPAIVVENRTSQPLIIYEESPATGARLSEGRYEPGHNWALLVDCTYTDIVVEDLDGNELARRPGPFCLEDSPWTLTDETIAQTNR